MAIHFAGTELKRFRIGLIPRMALVVILFIPLVYGALYLWAFWDPMSHMGELPVALVNEDQSARADDGTTVAAGDEVVDKLVDRGDLGWHETSAAEAERGVKNGTYYFSVTIPDGFSRSIATASGDGTAQAAQIQVDYDDSNSYLATEFGSNAMKQIRTATAETISEQAADTMIVGVNKLSDGVREASTGSRQLAAGASQTASGARTLSFGLQQLADGTAKLTDSTGQLTDGADTLAAGTAQGSAGAQQLADGARQVAGGAATAHEKAGELAAGAAQVSSGTGSASAASGTLADGAQQVADGTQAAHDGAQQIAEGAQQLADGTGDAKTASAQIAAGAKALQAGTDQALAGAQALSSGSAQVSAGISGQTGSLNAALRQMNEGVEQLPGQMTALATGVSQLTDGAHALVGALTTPRQGQSASLADGAAQAATGAAELRDGLSQADSTLKSTAAGVDADQEAALGALVAQYGSLSLQQVTGNAPLMGQIQATDPSLAALVQATAGTSPTMTLADFVQFGLPTAQAYARVVTTADQDGNGTSDWDALTAGAASLADANATISAGIGSASDSADKDPATVVSGAKAVAGGLDELEQNTGSPTDGELVTSAQQLAAGVATLEQLTDANGPDTITDPTTGQQTPNLAKGAQQVADGAATLAGQHGLAALSSGAQTLADGTGQLSAGATQLDSGASTLASGASTLASQSGTLASGAQQVAGGSRQLSGGLATLTSGSDLVSAGAGTLAGDAGLAQLDSGASQVSTGASTLASGSTQLAAGAQTLASGTHQLADGAGDLNSGASDASSGSGTLADGTDKVADGAKTLASKVSEGASQAPSYDTDQRSALAKFVSAPIVLDEAHVHAAAGFGEGFAPFFFALATFVGAIITWLILRPLPTRTLASNVSGFRSVLAGYLPSTLIALGQVVIMMTVLYYGVGLHPDNIAGTALFTLLVAMTFLAFQQMLIILFGSAIGRVIALVLLMFQLSSSGGTYPVETTPRFFQAIQPYMPATYVVNGLRQLITGGVETRLWIALLYLGALLVASLAISSVAAARQKVWTPARLWPEITV